MSYRNPRFGTLHSALINGSASIALTAGSETAGTLDRLRDGRSGLGVEITPSGGEVQIVHDRGALLGDQRQIERSFIPAGHTLEGKHLSILDSALGLIPNADHPLVQTYAGHDAVDYPLVDSGELEQISLEILTGSPVEMGEWWLTGIEAPQTGVVPAFSPGDAAFQGVRGETLAGAATAYQTGPSRRDFAFRHDAIEGADLEIYRGAQRRSEALGNSLVFDHPDSGGRDVDVATLDDPAKLTASNATVGQIPDSEGTANGALLITADNSGFVEIDIPFNGGANGDPLDLEGADWFLVCTLVGATSWLSSDSDFQVRWSTDASDRFSRRDIAAGFIDAIGGGASVVGKWARYHLANRAFTAVGNGGPGMVNRITNLRLRLNGLDPGDGIAIERVVRAQTDRQPIVAEWLDLTMQQSSPNPKAVAFFDVRAALREVIA